VCAANLAWRRAADMAMDRPLPPDDVHAPGRRSARGKIVGVDEF
jgi:hypothetical protein